MEFYYGHKEAKRLGIPYQQGNVDPEIEADANLYWIKRIFEGGASVEDFNTYLEQNTALRQY